MAVDGRTAIQVVVLGAIIVIGFLIIGSLVAVDAGVTDDSQSDTVTIDSTGTFVTIYTAGPFTAATGTDETVRNTRNKSINLTGADDSFVESEDAVDIASDQNWTVSLWAHVDEGSASDNMTAVSIDGRVLAHYNGSASPSNWSVWYYDEGNRNSFSANVSAPNQPGNFTHVVAKANGTNLTIYRNNTRGDVVDINISDASNTKSAPVNNANWDGRLDEVRMFNESLDSTNRSELEASPIAPQPDTDRTARIMFDEANKNTQAIFFTDSRLKQSNASFSEGLNGTVLTAGTDYEWRESPPGVRTLAGGAVDGAPAVYVDWTLEETRDAERLAERIASGLLLGSVAIIALFAAVIFRQLRSV